MLSVAATAVPAAVTALVPLDGLSSSYSTCVVIAEYAPGGPFLHATLTLSNAVEISDTS